MRFLIYFLVSHTIPPRGVVTPEGSPPVFKTGVSLTLAFCTVLCVYQYESLLCRIFFLFPLESVCMKPRAEAEWCPTSHHCFTFTVRYNKPTNKPSLTLLAPTFSSQPTSSTAQDPAFGPAEPSKIHIHKGPTSVPPPRSTGDKTTAPNPQEDDERQGRQAVTALQQV